MSPRVRPGSAARRWFSLAALAGTQTTTTLQELAGADHRIDWEDGEAVSVSLANRPEIGDNEMPILLAHPAIKELYLGGSGLTDEGTKVLRGLPQLEWLELSDTAVTNASIETLSGMTTLRFFFLYGCQITDECLPSLMTLANLRKIGLDDTLISSAGRNTLRQALPGVEIS